MFEAHACRVHRLVEDELEVVAVNSWVSFLDAQRLTDGISVLAEDLSGRPSLCNQVDNCGIFLFRSRYLSRGAVDETQTLH